MCASLNILTQKITCTPEYLDWNDFALSVSVYELLSKHFSWSAWNSFPKFVSECYLLISPSAAYMRRWIGSALAQIIVCRVFGAKPLSKPMLGYC